jgi:single-strand DNA-binding protein
VFAQPKIKLIEAAVQTGTRVRLVGQIRPGSWEDERGQTRYQVEFVVTGQGDVEVLARGKPKADLSSSAAPESAPPRARRGKMAAAGEAA